MATKNDTKKDPKIEPQEPGDQLPVVEDKAPVQEEAPKTPDTIMLDIPFDRLKILEDELKIAFKRVVNSKLLGTEYLNRPEVIRNMKQNVATLETALRVIAPLKKDIEDTRDFFTKCLETAQ